MNLARKRLLRRLEKLSSRASLTQGGWPGGGAFIKEGHLLQTQKRCGEGGYLTRGVHYRARGCLLQCRSFTCWKKSCEVELKVSLQLCAKFVLRYFAGESPILAT